MVEDARSHPVFSKLKVTGDVNIGSYIGVPILFSDGSVVGTLCGIDPQPRHFAAQEVQYMQVLARMMGAILEKRHGIISRTLAPANSTLKATQSMLQDVLDSGKKRQTQLPVGVSGQSSARQIAIRPTVLLVDDSPVNRKRLNDWLSEAGYSVLDLKPPYQASQVAQIALQYNAALVVVADSEPLEERVEFVRQIRHNPALLKLPILYMLQQRVNSIKAYYAGASRCLINSVDQALFIDEARKLTGQS